MKNTLRPNSDKILIFEFLDFFITSEMHLSFFFNYGYIISVSHLRHVITISNIVLALIVFIYDFLVFLRRKRKHIFLANQIGHT